MVSDLVRYEHPQSGEFDLLDLRQFVDDALYQHSDDSNYIDIPERDRRLVVILARVNLAESRLARMTGLEFPHTTLGGSSDRSGPAATLLAHIKHLRDDYDAQGGGDGNDEIHMGELVRTEKIMDRTVPTDTQPAPSAVILTKYKDVSGGNVWLRWTETKISDFFKYMVYRSTSAGLEDLSTLNETDPTFLGVVSTATELAEITSRWKTVYKDSGLSAGTYYYVVVLYDESGKISVSNELAVVVS